MYSTDGSLPYGFDNPTPEYYQSNGRIIHKLDIEVVIFAIQRPVIRVFRNLMNEITPY